MKIMNNSLVLIFLAMLCTCLSLAGRASAQDRPTASTPQWTYSEQAKEYLTTRTASIGGSRGDMLGLVVTQQQHKGRYASEFSFFYEFPSLPMSRLDDRISITVDGETLGSFILEKIPNHPNGYQTVFDGRDTDALFLLHTLIKRLGKGETVMLGFTASGLPSEERFFPLKDSASSIGQVINKSHAPLFNERASRHFLNYRTNGSTLDIMARLAVLDVALDAQSCRANNSSREKALLLAKHKHEGIPEAFLESVVDPFYAHDLPEDLQKGGPAALRRQFPAILGKSVDLYAATLKAGDWQEEEIRHLPVTKDLFAADKATATPLPATWFSRIDPNNAKAGAHAWVTNPQGDIFGLSVQLPESGQTKPVLRLFYSLNQQRAPQDTSRKIWLVVDNLVVAHLQASKKEGAVNHYFCDLDGENTLPGDPYQRAERIVSQLRKGTSLRLVYAENPKSMQAIAFSLHDSEKHLAALLHSSAKAMFAVATDETAPVSNHSRRLFMGLFVRDIFNKGLVQRQNGVSFEQAASDLAATYPALPASQITTVLSSAYETSLDALKSFDDIDRALRQLIPVDPFTEKTPPPMTAALQLEESSPAIAVIGQNQQPIAESARRKADAPLWPAGEAKWQTDLLHGKDGGMQHLAFVNNQGGEVFGIAINLVKANGQLYPDLAVTFTINPLDAAHPAELPVDITVDNRIVGSFMASKVLGKKHAFLVKPPNKPSDQEMARFRYLISSLKNGRSITIQQDRGPDDMRRQTFSLAGADRQINAILNDCYRVLFGASPGSSSIGHDVQYADLAPLVRLTEMFHPEPDKVIAGVLDRIIAANPKNISILTARCRIRANLQTYEDAARDCEEAIRLERLYGPAYSELGSVRMLTGDHAGAMENFQLACESGHENGCFNYEGFTGLPLAAVPDRVKNLAEEAGMMQQKGEWDKVLALNSEILSWDRKNAAAFASRAEAYARKGMLERAEDDARNALRWSPYSGQAHNHLGFIQELKGNHSKAVYLYGRACNLSYQEGCGNLQRLVSAK